MGLRTYNNPTIEAGTLCSLMIQWKHCLYRPKFTTTRQSRIEITFMTTSTGANHTKMWLGTSRRGGGFYSLSTLPPDRGLLKHSKHTLTQPLAPLMPLTIKWCSSERAD